MPLSLQVLWRARRMAPGRPAQGLEGKANVLTAIGRQLSVACSRQLTLAPSGGTRGWGVEPAQDVEQRRLARAGRFQRDKKFPLAYFKADIPEGKDPRVTTGVDPRQRARRTRGFARPSPGWG